MTRSQRGGWITLVILLLGGIAAWALGADDSTAQAAAQGKAADGIPTLAEIAATLDRADRKIANLRVEGFEMVEETLPAGANAWTRTPIRWTGTTWLDGPTGNRIRIRFDQRMLPWENGMADWIDSAEDIGFDGHTTRRVRLNGARSAIIVNRQRLPDSRLPYAIGTAFNLSYVSFDFGAEKKQQSAAAVLHDLAQRGVQVNITREVLGDTSVIKLAFRAGGGLGGQYRWLDPARGYALLKEEVSLPLGQGRTLHNIREVIELVEAAPGVWYPAAASYEEAKGNAFQDRIRWVYRARKVVANDPAFDPAVFTVPIPAGYRVSDQTKQ